MRSSPPRRRVRREILGLVQALSDEVCYFGRDVLWRADCEIGRLMTGFRETRFQAGLLESSAEWRMTVSARSRNSWADFLKSSVCGFEHGQVKIWLQKLQAHCSIPMIAFLVLS